MPSWRAAAGCGSRGRPGGRPGPQIGLAGLPPEMVERARWWEDHIIEVVDGTRPDAPAGTPPRPEYDVGRTSLREREQAKAAELSTPDRPVSASTVRHRRQRWQAEGLPGLVDRRVTRRRSPAGRADPASRRGDGAGDRRGDRRFVKDGDVHRLAHPAAAGRAGPGGQGAVTGHDVPAVLPAVGGQAHDRVRGHPPGPGGTAAADVLPGLPGGAGRADGDRLHAPGRHGAAGRRGAGSGGADRDDRRGDQDGARRGAAPHDEVGRRERAAGPRAHARADAARMAGEPGDGALGPALRPAAGHRRAAAARRGPAGDRAGHDRHRPRVGVRLGQLPVLVPAPGDQHPAGAPGDRVGQAAHREDVLLAGHAVLPVRRRLPRAAAPTGGAATWTGSRCGP